MGAIGEKIADYTGQVTSVTLTETGTVLNAEGEAGPFGTYLYTATFGPAVDPAGETGSLTGRVQDFRPDGSVVPQGRHRGVAQERTGPVGSEGDQHGRRRDVPFLRRSLGFGDAVAQRHDLRPGLSRPTATAAHSEGSCSGEQIPLNPPLPKGEARSAGGFLRQGRPPRKENYKVRHHRAPLTVDRLFPAGYLTFTSSAFHMPPASGLHAEPKSHKEDCENESNRIPIEPCPKRRGTGL